MNRSIAVGLVALIAVVVAMKYGAKIPLIGQYLA